MTNERYNLSDDDKVKVAKIDDALFEALDDLTWDTGEFAHLDDDEQAIAAQPREDAIYDEFFEQRFGTDISSIDPEAVQAVYDIMDDYGLTIWELARIALTNR